MPRTERAIQKEVMLTLSELGCLVWRCNTGTAWQGKTLHKTPSQITLGDCRPVSFGLTRGGSDLVGIAPNGNFLACEIKSATGRVSLEQQRFIDAVNAAGGLAFVARSADDARRAIEQLEQ